MQQTLEHRIESSLLYAGEDGRQHFVHDTYRDFFLARFFLEALRTKKKTLMDVYKEFFLAPNMDFFYQKLANPLVLFLEGLQSNEKDEFYNAAVELDKGDCPNTYRMQREVDPLYNLARFMHNQKEMKPSEDAKSNVARRLLERYIIQGSEFVDYVGLAANLIGRDNALNMFIEIYRESIKRERDRKDDVSSLYSVRISFSESAERGITHSRDWFVLSDFYSLGASFLIHVGSLEKAIEWCDEGIQKGYDRERLLSLKASANQERGRFREAEEICTANADPSNLEITTLGMVYCFNEQYEESVKAFKRRIELERTSPLVVLAETIPDEKIRLQIIRSMRVYDSLAIAQTNLAVVYEKMRRYDEAISLLEEALSKVDDLAIVHYNMGVCLYHKRDYDRALDSFFLALKFGSTNLGVPDGVFDGSRRQIEYIYIFKHVDEPQAEFKRELRRRGISLIPF